MAALRARSPISYANAELLKCLVPSTTPRDLAEKGAVLYQVVHLADLGTLSEIGYCISFLARQLASIKRLKSEPKAQRQRLASCERHQNQYMYALILIT